MTAWSSPGWRLSCERIDGYAIETLAGKEVRQGVLARGLAFFPLFLRRRFFCDAFFVSSVSIQYFWFILGKANYQPVEKRAGSFTFFYITLLP